MLTRRQLSRIISDNNLANKETRKSNYHEEYTAEGISSSSPHRSSPSKTVNDKNRDTALDKVQSTDEDVLSVCLRNNFKFIFVTRFFYCFAQAMSLPGLVSDKQQPHIAYLIVEEALRKSDIEFWTDLIIRLIKLLPGWHPINRETWVQAIHKEYHRRRLNPSPLVQDWLTNPTTSEPPTFQSTVFYQDLTKVDSMSMATQSILEIVYDLCSWHLHASDNLRMNVCQGKDFATSVLLSHHPLHNNSSSIDLGQIERLMRLNTIKLKIPKNKRRASMMSKQNTDSSSLFTIWDTNLVAFLDGRLFVMGKSFDDHLSFQLIAHDESSLNAFINKLLEESEKDNDTATLDTLSTLLTDSLMKPFLVDQERRSALVLFLTSLDDVHFGSLYREQHRWIVKHPLFIRRKQDFYASAFDQGIFDSFGGDARRISARVAEREAKERSLKEAQKKKIEIEQVKRQAFKASLLEFSETEGDEEDVEDEYEEGEQGELEDTEDDESSFHSTSQSSPSRSTYHSSSSSPFKRSKRRFRGSSPKSKENFISEREMRRLMREQKKQEEAAKEAAVEQLIAEFQEKNQVENEQNAEQQHVELVQSNPLSFMSEANLVPKIKLRLRLQDDDTGSNQSEERLQDQTTNKDKVNDKLSTNYKTSEEKIDTANQSAHVFALRSEANGTIARADLSNTPNHNLKNDEAMLLANFASSLTATGEDEEVMSEDGKAFSKDDKTTSTT